MSVPIIMVLSYFLGAIPFAYIITRFFSGKDVREYGSGNVGATNASRVMGIKYGVIVAGLDIFKGFIVVLIAQSMIPENMTEYFTLLAALLAIIGHNWSIFLKFSGGKGVATTFGILLKLLPLIFAFYAVIWLGVVALTRYVSLASIIGALSLPILVFLFNGGQPLILFTVVLAAFILIRHYSNIKRLINGTESKINWSSLVKKGDA